MSDDGGQFERDNSQVSVIACVIPGKIMAIAERKKGAWAQAQAAQATLGCGQHRRRRDFQSSSFCKEGAGCMLYRKTRGFSGLQESVSSLVHVTTKPPHSMPTARK